MNLPLDLALNDKPDIEIQHQEPLTMEISHSIVQTMSGKNLLLLTVYVIANCRHYCYYHCLLKYQMDKKYTILIFLTLYTRGVFHLPQLSKPNIVALHFFTPFKKS